MKAPRDGSRIASAVAALILVVLLAVGTILALVSDQVFLAVIGAIGALLTGWAFVSARKAA